MPDRPLSIDIRHPLILKANELVWLSRHDGNFPLEVPGFGLFYRDTCVLGAYALRLHGTDPLVLMASDCEGMAAQIELTNKRLRSTNGQTIPDHKLSLRRTLLLLDDGAPTFTDVITLRNYTRDTVHLPISLEFCARFESTFVLRGSPHGKRGQLLAPGWEERALRFCYEGADDVRRTLLVEFSRLPVVAPCTAEQAVAHFMLSLEPLVPQELIVMGRIDERAMSQSPPAPSGPRAVANVRRAKEAAAARLLQGYARVETTNRDLGETLARSLSDLALLQVRRGEHRFTAAGVPWFLGLFGRDSLLPSIQCLAFNPDLASDTVRALAAWQGKQDNEKTHEQPGKILHELRVGELAHLHAVSATPSYASVDATLLFLIAIGRHVGWSGDLSLFRDLRPNVEAALGWLERQLALGGGYVTYAGKDDDGQPVNQSWRDSDTGVLRHDGDCPEPPLALVEVQGYAFQAMTLVAALLRRIGEETRAQRLETAASALRERFARDFWMEAEGCYCLALERGGRQVASVTSNSAQVLWTGIASTSHASRIATRMMRADMFSGWGVRTLSADHVAYDPLAYQQGSVWSFDNSLIVSGLRRYGEDAAALRITAAALDAARLFHGRRLPEFMAGIQRQAGDSPMHTPRADPLQAWSAAAVPFLVTELLGLQADGFAKCLRVCRPLLPEGVDELALYDLRAGGATASIRFTRDRDRIDAEVLASSELKVMIQH